jgi:hypothetical protein
MVKNFSPLLFCEYFLTFSETNSFKIIFFCTFAAKNKEKFDELAATFIYETFWNGAVSRRTR